MNKKVKYGSAILAASLILGACSANNDSKPKDDKGSQTTKVSYGNWNTFGYDYGLSRHVPFAQITKENVKDLGVLWSKKFKELDANVPNGNQSFPVVVDGVAYVTTANNYVFAFNAVTGEKVWEWAPPKEVLDTITKTGMAGTNRGVSVGDGKVFMTTADNGIVSIDAKTGKTVKFVHLSDFDSMKTVTAENGYYESQVPVYYKGKLLVGSAGSDNGVRGFFTVFNADDLTPAWDQPFWTVPPKGEDWLKNSGFGGGGTVWMPASVDSETDTMYISVANPAPDFYGEDRPGANPHTDSVVALDINTGKLIWEQQQLSHDLWDYDTAESPDVVTAKVNGKDQKVVMVGTKGAEWFAYDAKTGTPIYKNVAFGKIDHPKPTPEGVMVYPGVLGGQNYAPDTFDPESNLTLIPSIEQPGIYKSARNEEDVKKNGGFFGAFTMGTTFAMPTDIPAKGKITAINLNDGKIAWQIDTPEPQRGGLTSTKTGISFYGELSGKVKALETATGKELWSFQTTGDSIGAAPTVFEQDGKEYVMITSAGKDPQIFVFAIGGDKTQGQAKGGVDTSTSPHEQKSDAKK
jgi:PQQ-dependent dehydrogenase (methanol/ethanol family)